ncbi:probable LRR receptor-like serine/threonine-protein kinase At1g06840 [Salvia splendens]|uniref:probable LRR receptor-like serine/threonine-protein kinase At1g06840 n=1 Tax=Salvia splendens TaxID=180675 RepID=UPI001104F96F|nr:probable LRR receptor-like serine/threonine-protein kinase At1g06840 [Salvia splendens]XP_042017603.1 probable LRR receptor-like serine/threonine-protein kinase At1g06840 [Salvia splendens]XP_042017604.1 probable LRR receptor-like serine/threonine-protein kinase At1g06840 [Salvia splendens]XP_042017605.1 probable LRR receptor-like serine/threonine-protein kinase At1g06840 [Salvia splendens]
MAIFGVAWLSSWNVRLILVMCLCWYLLLLGAHSQRTDPNEVNSLRAIKKSLNDPFKHLDRWNRGDPCLSNWTGIICHNVTFADGHFHVSEVSVMGRNLTGTLSPELGRLSYLKILDFMWNNITGTIPKEIGNITTLELLLVNGNQLTGSLPEELGNLVNLDRIQIDQNFISGPIPPSLANLDKAKHFHMNNNSLSGQIPSALARLPNLVHLLLDNNNLSGPLPLELSEMPNLLILQLDNNNFNGSEIPSSYGNIPTLLKLSLRNCSLRGTLPDWSNSTNIAYIDLSLNQLTGPIPTGALSRNITTIDLSRNGLTGSIPGSFSGLPLLQKLSVANNSLNGSIPSGIWQNRTMNATEKVLLDFGFNSFSNIGGTLPSHANITIGLEGNPVCLSNNLLVKECGPHDEDFNNISNTTTFYGCTPQGCPDGYEYAPPTPTARCICMAPVFVGYRLKSPGFSDFLPYVNTFKEYLSTGLEMNLSQLEIQSAEWQDGPRIKMDLKVFPSNVTSKKFNRSEVLWIREMFSGWRIPDNQVFGPYEFLSFTLSSSYDEDIFGSGSSGLSKGALAGVILGTIAGSVTLSAIVSILILRRHTKKHHKSSRRRPSTRISIRIDGVKDFTYRELALATNDFDESTVVGSGGYGKVHRGVLANGTIVAIKRAQEGSLQGEKEFLTEIELLSRLHHRNLVSLIGYCDEEGEQMLVYEFMPNGTLRDHLSTKAKMPLTFARRVKIALGSARGILYLHTEANPPIFHRDIKATNILLDSTFTAKVADFGLSRLAPLPELEGGVPSHVSTVVKGTPGYLDPEYFLTHKLTDKSDVYSLGVVFLEMLTGMHPISHGKNIVREVNIAHRSGMIFSIIDEQMGSYPSECIEKFINLALKCCQEETDSRPSMAEVHRELENIWFLMPESDTNISESLTSDSGKLATTPTSSSSTRNPYLSQDVSGSDLISGVVPTIAPR